MQPPASAHLALPYKEDFESYVAGVTPKYWSDFGGAFEVAKRADGQGQALRQVITKDGITWDPDPFPETLMGDPAWKDLTITADVMVEGDGFASLFGRVSSRAQNGDPPRGVWLKVETNGQWTLSQRVSHKRTDPATGKDKKIDVDTVIGHGTSSFPPNKWQQLRLSFQGDQVSATINGTDVGSGHTDCVSGSVGIGCGWHAAQFDNITIR